MLIFFYYINILFHERENQESYPDVCKPKKEQDVRM